jgi:hypothetical protein
MCTSAGLTAARAARAKRQEPEERGSCQHSSPSPRKLMSRAVPTREPCVGMKRAFASLDTRMQQYIACTTCMGTCFTDGGGLSSRARGQTSAGPASRGVSTAAAYEPRRALTRSFAEPSWLRAATRINVSSERMCEGCGGHGPDTVEDEEPHGRAEGLSEEVVLEPGQVRVKAGACALDEDVAQTAERQAADREQRRPWCCAETETETETGSARSEAGRRPPRRARPLAGPSSRFSAPCRTGLPRPPFAAFPSSLCQRPRPRPRKGDVARPSERECTCAPRREAQARRGRGRGPARRVLL